MTLKFAALFAASIFATPMFAEGDAELGAKTFKKCKSCHMIKNGDDIIVKGGKTGPNLYGVIGRTAGSVEGYKYGKSLVEAGEQGLVWDAESVADFTADPKAYLKEVLDDPKAKSKMSLRLKKGAEDVVAYLESVVE